MLIAFKDNKTYEWILETDSNSLPIVPNKGDFIWLKEHNYVVKKKQFAIVRHDPTEMLLYIYVKRTNKSA